LLLTVFPETFQRICCPVTKDKELTQIVDKTYGKYSNVLLGNVREEGRKKVVTDESHGRK
jgi:hypothetical protein